MNSQSIFLCDDYSFKIKKFGESISEWGKFNMRNFPWRNTDDPYRILISEILLHRTKAEQVVKIYSEFLQKYPDIFSIARSSRQTLQKDLFSLGLRWRAEKLLKMGRKIEKEYSGKIPNTIDELLKLPGIGEYTASAVLVFAFNKPAPLLDVNIVRVLGRYFCLEINENSRRSKFYRKLIVDIMNETFPRIFSYSLIDLGSLICRKNLKNGCDQCPVKENCCFRKRLKS